jgi:hypothetical protein
MPSLPLTVIQPSPRVSSLKLKDFWEYRELLDFLIYRDVQSKLQTNHPGGSLGRFAAGFHHDSVRHLFRAAGQSAFQWPSLPDFQFLRPVAPAAICPRP